jgi:large subunit ribosomal protein L14
MQTGTVVKVADNSGPCYLRIIKILKSTPKAVGKIGNHIVGSVLYVHQRKKFKVKKGSIVRGIYIRMTYPLIRKGGLRLKFQFPAVVIASRKGIPKGTLIYGPVAKEIRQMGYIRLVSLSTIAI